jgi:hypothetical protein
VLDSIESSNATPTEFLQNRLLLKSLPEDMNIAEDGIAQQILMGMSAAEGGDSEAGIGQARGYEESGVGVGDPWLDDRYMMGLPGEVDFATFQTCPEGAFSP